MLLLPLLCILAVISEAFQRSIGGAAAAAAAVAMGGRTGSFDGVGGGIGAFFGGGTSGGAELGRFLETAGDVGDTLFVIWSVWYTLRFFR